MKPPYDPYEAKPSTIRTYADSIVTQATSAGSVDSKALGKKAEAAENITGELTDKLDEPFDTVGKDAKKISLTSAFVAGSLYKWASAIDTFNTGVDGLNTRWNNRPSGPSGGISPAELETQLIEELNKDWGKLDTTLDGEAADLKVELDQGPDEKTVLAYFANGVLPESALPLLTGLGIDPKKVQSALTDLRKFLKDSKDGKMSKERMDAWFNLLKTIKDLDPKAATVILGALDDQELKDLGEYVGGVDESHMNSATDLYSFLLAGATKEQVDRMKKQWDLNPGDRGDWQDPRYSNPLFGSTNGETKIGANQGPVNDCWLLAKLNAIVGSDPSWPQQHVRDNGNGTVSVKFYDDGNPYWVTVTKEVALDGDGNYQTAYPDGSNSQMWAVYYEKAMAVDDHGADGILGGDGYDGLTAGFSDSADEYMTGKESDNVKFTGLNPFADPYSDVKEAIADGKGVVASNWSNSPLPWNGGDDDLKQYHVYYVKEIESDGDVVLGNPWGKDDVTLSPDEFNDYMEDVSIVNQ
ncbi:C2 family cysteine protease [Nocardioidaceae bacterium SCSIO 66511]|nr:C2 family cysteine protease [Nocardioidaceae bacterium SCSIO 66511]